jgi:PDZ domain-containing protein
MRLVDFIIPSVKREPRLSMKVWPTLITVIVFACPLCSQDLPRVELFAGYSYLNADTNNLSSRQSLNGWEASSSMNFTKWLATEFDGAGYYKSYSIDTGGFAGLPNTVSFHAKDYSYLAGPRFNLRPFFVHALVGGDHLVGSALGYSASQDGLSGAFGGGGEVPIGRLLSFRVSADYAFSRHNILGGPSVTQNNFRFGFGIVWRLGHLREVGSPSAAATPRSTAPASASPPAMPAHSSVRANPTREAEPTRSEASDEDSLTLGVTGKATAEGFQVTDVREGSPAGFIFLIPGDVIQKIDGKDVHSGADIEMAIAASASGKVVVVGLTKTNLGAIQFEREAKIR